MNRKTLEKKAVRFFESKIFAAVLFAYLSFAFIAAALSSHWTHSELFAAHTARLLFSEFSRDFLFSLKPLYNLFLFLSFQVSAAFSVFPLTAGRVFSALIGFSAAFTVWFLIRKKAGAFPATLALLILIGSPIFLERGFRIRSDMAAALLILAGLCFPPVRENSLKKSALSLLPFTALFITPKSLYFILAASLSLRRLLREKSPVATTSGGFRKPGALKKSLLKNKTTVFAVLFLPAAGFLFHDPFFLKAIKEAGLYYLHSLQEIQTAGLSKHGFFLFRFASKNLFLSGLILLKGFFVLQRFVFAKRRIFRENAGDAAFLILCFALFFHPFPKPFFIASLAPFFLLTFFLDPYLKAWKPGRALRLFLLGAFSLFAIFMTVSHLNFTFRRNNNFFQQEIVGKLNILAEAQSQAGAAIYDPQAFVFSQKAPHVRQWFNKGRSGCRRFLQNSARFDVIYSLPCPDLFKFRHFQISKAGSGAGSGSGSASDSPKEAENLTVKQNLARNKETARANGKKGSADLKKRQAGLFWTNIGKNHIYYKSCHIDASLLAGRKGENVLSLCEAAGFYLGGRSANSRTAKSYWHVFLNENKKPLLKPASSTDAAKAKKSSAGAKAADCKQTLCPHVMYSKQEFLNGVFPEAPEGAPEEAKEAALFFLAPPESFLTGGFPENIPLNTLLRYDIL